MKPIPPKNRIVKEGLSGASLIPLLILVWVIIFVLMK